jgi:alpha-glucoside transport system substrate-binding protein
MALTLAACGDDDEGEATPGATGSPATVGSPTPQQLGTVSALGIWGAEELTNFEAMVAPWQDETGGRMSFTGTRNITADLTLRVEGGNPPDVAIPAEIGLMRDFARSGKIVPLSQCQGLEKVVRDNYPKGFIDLATIDGKLYGFFMKADTKATVWYNPELLKQRNLTPPGANAKFDELIAFSEKVKNDAGVPPWSIGMEAGEGSGFPGTDWIQQIILNEAGEQTYDGLIDGSVMFTDPKVKDAWEKFGKIALTQGFTVQEGATGINATNFRDATFAPFQSPPQAAMTYLGGFASGFITQQFPNAKAGEAYDFFTFPGGKVTGGANVVYAFNNEPTTCSFLTHLASAEAQRIWVDRGGFTSVNKQVSLEAYPDPVARKQAEQLLNAETFRFDLDDAIGGRLQQAFFQGVTQFLQNPGNLDDILRGIESSREQR